MVPPNQVKDHDRESNLTLEARSRGGQNSPGSLKGNPDRAAEIGRKGGEHSHGGGRHSA